MAMAARKFDVIEPAPKRATASPREIADAVKFPPALQRVHDELEQLEARRVEIEAERRSLLHENIGRAGRSDGAISRLVAELDAEWIALKPRWAALRARELELRETLYHDALRAALRPATTAAFAELVRLAPAWMSAMQVVNENCQIAHNRSRAHLGFDGAGPSISQFRDDFERWRAWLVRVGAIDPALAAPMPAPGPGR